MSSGQDRLSRWWQRPVSLRTHLRTIVLIALLPMFLLSVAVGGLLALQQRATFRRGAIDRTRALVTAMDTELKRSIAALEALATSDELEQGDLPGFEAEANRVLWSRPEWLAISLATTTGTQRLLMQHEVPLIESGETLDQRSFDEVLWTRKPTIGRLVREPHEEFHFFPVRVPVLVQAEVEYVLSAWVTPRAIHTLLLSQSLPDEWVGVVLDRDDVIAARTVADAQRVGKPASPSLRRALAEAPQGWFRGTTLEQWPVYTPYTRSPFSGWAVATGIPRDSVDGPFVRSLVVLTACGLGALVFGMALAWLLGRRGARSLEGLARMAEHLGAEDELPRPLARGLTPGTSRVAEVEQLRQAFGKAARLIRQRSEERDRVVDSLREAHQNLEDSDRRKDQFLAMLGHELRNPLGVISNAVQVMRLREADNAESQELREMMERQVGHMKRLIDDLLDVSRIAQGRAQLELAICDLSAIVRQTTDDHHETLRRNGLELETRLPDHPLWVHGDETRLTQVVANVLHNASKFTEAGGRVSVSLVETDTGEQATLTIRDTGVGMTPEILAQAFEPFSQADRTIDRSRGGLGLGLVLIKGLIELHGGSVQLASDGPGLGTELTIELPLAPAVQESEQPVTPVHDPERRYRVLVVEDNQQAARSLELFLRDSGHTVEVAHTGRAGVEAARRFAPQVVLCDIGLPELSGYEVAAALRRELPANGPPTLIAVTGYGQELDRRRARAAGFDEHLTKPVDLTRLTELLARL